MVLSVCYLLPVLYVLFFFNFVPSSASLDCDDFGADAFKHAPPRFDLSSVQLLSSH